MPTGKPRKQFPELYKAKTTTVRKHKRRYNPRVVHIHHEDEPKLDIKAMIDNAHRLFENAHFNIGIGLSLVAEARKKIT